MYDIAIAEICIFVINDECKRNIGANSIVPFSFGVLFTWC